MCGEEGGEWASERGGVFLALGGYGGGGVVAGVDGGWDFGGGGEGECGGEGGVGRVLGGMGMGMEMCDWRWWCFGTIEDVPRYV